LQCIRPVRRNSPPPRRADWSFVLKLDDPRVGRDFWRRL